MKAFLPLIQYRHLNLDVTVMMSVIVRTAQKLIVSFGAVRYLRLNGSEWSIRHEIRSFSHGHKENLVCICRNRDRSYGGIGVTRMWFKMHRRLNKSTLLVSGRVLTRSMEAIPTDRSFRIWTSPVINSSVATHGTVPAVMAILRSSRAHWLKSSGTGWKAHGIFIA